MNKNKKQTEKSTRGKEILIVFSVLAIVLCAILVYTLVIDNKKPANPVVTTPTEATTEAEEVIVPNSVPDDSDEALAVKNAVTDYLNTFISCDMDAIQAMLHEEDKWLFNFESESQMNFYNTIFPEISYELDYVSEYEGVYGVMATITSPSMADVYGTIITEYIDSATGNSEVSVEEIMANNEERMLSMITSEEIPDRVQQLYIYVECIDGVYIPRCDAYLANELTGGAPEASDEISSVLYETMTALSGE